MTISVVVPCFNEEESIPLFYRDGTRSDEDGRKV